MNSLNAGCGAHYVEGWINVDVKDRHRADIHVDLADLPFDGQSIDRIFACHVLEHLEYHKQLPQVLSEFYRVLAPSGELCVVGPDIERAVALGESGQVLRAIIAWPEEFNVGSWEAMTPPTGHAWTATSPLVEQALDAGGFVFTCYSGRLHHLPNEGWPLANFALYQNGYVCQKRESAPYVDQ